MTFVIDASVGVKWLHVFAGEPLVNEALELLERRTHQQVEMLVPDLFWLEVGNVLWKTARSKDCTADDAKKALALLNEQALRTISSAPSRKSPWKLPSATDVPSTKAFTSLSLARPVRNS